MGIPSWGLTKEMASGNPVKTIEKAQVGKSVQNTTNTTINNPWDSTANSPGFFINHCSFVSYKKNRK